MLYDVVGCGEGDAVFGEGDRREKTWLEAPGTKGAAVGERLVDGVFALIGEVLVTIDVGVCVLSSREFSILRTPSLTGSI